MVMAPADEAQDFPALSSEPARPKVILSVAHLNPQHRPGPKKHITGMALKMLLVQDPSVAVEGTRTSKQMDCHPRLHRANLADNDDKEATHAQHHRSHTRGHLYSATSMVDFSYN